MNKNYLKFINLNFFLNKNYIFLLYDFKNIKSILINNIKKTFFKIKIFFCNSKILKFITIKKSFFVIILKDNFEENCIFIKYLKNKLEIIPFYLLNKKIIIENIPLKEISNLSKNNLIIKFIELLKLNFLKFLNIIKKIWKKLQLKKF